MEIRKGKVVALEYTLEDDNGVVIDKSGREPLYFLQGHGNVVPGLEEALEGRKAGDSFKVSLPPEKGYGTYDEKLIQRLPLSRLPAGTSPMKGRRYTLEMGNQTRTVTVTKVRLADVEIDANHPFADQTLHFSLRVRNVRDATRSELEHRHAHPPKPNR